MTPQLRLLLKENTKRVHQRVDDMFSELDLAKYEDFTKFIQVHYFSFCHLMKSLDEAHRLRDTFVELLHCLEADVASLECGDQLPGPQLLPENTTKLHPLGMVYVIAGSHFGKKVLKKRWSRSLDHRVLAACHYMGSDANRRMWAAFLSECETASLSAFQQNSVIEGAKKTFETFEHFHRAIE